jgi:hypothetical protein
MQVSHTVTAPLPVTPSPIAWLLVEERGSQRADAGRYDLTTVQLQPAEEGRAQLVDGRMTYPWDRGQTERWYESSPWALKNGVDPEAAATAARTGVELLTAATERAVGDLAPFAVGMNDRLPRDPDSFEVWLRREDGTRSRFVLPLAQAPASLAGVRSGMQALGTVLRANYDQLDPQEQELAG